MSEIHVRGSSPFSVAVIFRLAQTTESLDLREHAIFTLHNLLQGNPENQKIVDDIRPAGQWDENGVLRDTVGAVRK